MTSTSDLACLVAREAAHARDFAELSAACFGAWPGLVRDILATANTDDARRLLETIRTRRTQVTTDRRLPLAHPLDADWRFTRESADDTLDALLSATPDGGSMLLIAMPTVALAAYDRGLTDRFVVASRIGDPVDAALRLAMPQARFDDFHAPTRARFHTVGVDPPWYDDVAGELMTAAQAQVRERGRVFVCIPDRFTLPSAAPRLAALAENPVGMGFLKSATIGALRYAMPYFEKRSLEAIGITNVDPHWRTGTLVVCQPSRAPTPSRSSVLAMSSAWREVTLQRARIWVRQTPGAGQEEHVSIATSVSRSDPARATAQVWTSGNTVAWGYDGKLDDLELMRWPKGLAKALTDEVAAITQAVSFE